MELTEKSTKINLVELKIVAFLTKKPCIKIEFKEIAHFMTYNIIIHTKKEKFWNPRNEKEKMKRSHPRTFCTSFPKKSELLYCKMS